MTISVQLSKSSEVIILVTPAAYLKAANWRAWKMMHLEGKTVCSGIKGIIPVDNYVTGEYLISSTDDPG
ncbi:MAG: hypothetical protein MZV63_51860 [Marinilabiliales bacterium]|nr:hypothetical protein [Marinilabiliales bacterium]